MTYKLLTLNETNLATPLSPCHDKVLLIPVTWYSNRSMRVDKEEKISLIECVNPAKIACQKFVGDQSGLMAGGLTTVKPKLSIYGHKSDMEAHMCAILIAALVAP